MIRPGRFSFIFLLATALACVGNNTSSGIAGDTVPVKPAIHFLADSPLIRTIHVFVALCDNKYQGIVPVPASIGNGQRPETNLYWGCTNGIKSYFTRSKEWTLVSSGIKPSPNIVERLLFKHKTKPVYLLADAYDGQFIKQTTVDFLNSCSGNKDVEIQNGKKSIFFGGKSDLLAYIGHDGLMDFSIEQTFKPADNKKRDAIILACYSKNYFSSFLQSVKANPLLWTSGLMCPEAYTLHDAIHEWMSNQPESQVREAAAKAYSKYQKCSLKAAKNLLVQGW